MKMLKIILIIIILHSANLFAWDDLRNLEPVIIYGYAVFQFVASPVDHIFVYAFNAQQQTWHQVTFQIDEKDTDGTYYGVKDGLLGDGEEIIVLAKDAGDWTSSYYWIDDEDARLNTRYQIEVNDPFDPLAKKYFYIYKSSTLQRDTSLTQYINYIPSSRGNDTVEAVNYAEGHSGGIPITWIIPDSVGGAGVDLLDRQKARVKGKYSGIGFNLNESDGLSNPRVTYLAGPIRISRRVKFDLELAGFNVDDVSFEKQYYPYFIHTLRANKKLKSDYGISLIRQSYDLNVNAVGMQFYNSFNSGILIDGKREVPISTLFLEPEPNWYLVTGDQGSIVNIFEVEAIGSKQELYWWDDNEKGHTGDGTDDTGDNKSYGDVGVKLTGSKMTGSLGMPMHIYFLEANQDSALGPALVENYKTPLWIKPVAENFTSPIAVSLPDTSQKQGLKIAVPLVIDNDITAIGILSADIIIHFDDQVIQALDATTTGTIAESWGEPSLSIDADSIRLHLEGSSPLTGSGELVFLHFKIIGAEGTQSVLQFKEMTFNNGQILTNPGDGSITALAPVEVITILPDTSQQKGLSISIPIRVQDITGLDVTSVQISLAFNSMILDATGASTINTISAGWGAPSFTKKSDGIEISMSGAASLEGQGELAYIHFDVTGEPEQTTALSFTRVSFNEGVPVAAPQNGSFTTLAPPEVVVSIPDTTGEQLSTVQIPIYVGNLTDLNVTSIKINLSFDGSVLDVIQVMNLGTITSNWDAPEFNDGTDEIEFSLTGANPLTGSGKLVYVEFHVIGKAKETTTLQISHIQFNRGNPAGIPAGGLFTVTPARIDVSLLNQTGLSASTISVPVMVGDLTALDVISVNMMISYDPTVLDAVAVRTRGTLTATWETPIFNDFSNRAHIILKGNEPIKGGGILVYIDFKIIGLDGSSSPLHFINFVFNSGSPVAIKHDGQIKAEGTLYRLAISIPDTSMVQGESIKMPVIVDDLTGMGVYSARVSLSFDSQIIDATGVTTDGTLSSSWDRLEFDDLIDIIDIILSGRPLSEGKGTLFYINFNVIGKPGNFTEIYFERVLFNQGNPVALTDHGSLTVLDAPKIMISIPDTTSDQGATIKIPIRIGNVTELNITSAQLTLSFADSVLDATGISNEGTLSSSWSSIHFIDGATTIIMGLSGDSPLTGEGDLVYVNFDVVGEPGDSTVIHFEKIVLSNELPVPIMKDGSLKVIGVIPVELASFEGFVRENKIILSWTTASESNNYGFEVQRSRSDLKWETIGFVPGKGTTSIPQSYIFYDQNNEPGAYNYRLRQIDYDGAIAYSDMIQIIADAPQHILLKQNYPNPFNSKTVVNYQIPENDHVRLTIYNLLGNEICTLVDKNQSAGFYSVEWNGRNDSGNPVPSGVYIYLLESGKVTIVKKMILLE